MLPAAGPRRRRRGGLAGVLGRHAHLPAALRPSSLRPHAPGDLRRRRAGAVHEAGGRGGHLPEHHVGLVHLGARAPDPAMAAVDLLARLCGVLGVLPHARQLYLRGAGDALGHGLEPGAGRAGDDALPPDVRRVQVCERSGGGCVGQPRRLRGGPARQRGAQPRHHLRQRAQRLRRGVAAVGGQWVLPGVRRPSLRQAAHQMVPHQRARQVVGHLDGGAEHGGRGHPHHRRIDRRDLRLALRHGPPGCHRGARRPGAAGGRAGHAARGEPAKRGPPSPAGGETGPGWRAGEPHRPIGKAGVPRGGGHFGGVHLGCGDEVRLQEQGHLGARH
mmetsp:Transcript_25133/g.54683  ORF Transcript_25133/g.54683 Transcript_25133/m.54683 type:complete len:331 (-) Transcript_25133:1198-2190(-)